MAKESDVILIFTEMSFGYLGEAIPRVVQLAQFRNENIQEDVSLLCISKSCQVPGICLKL